MSKKLDELRTKSKQELDKEIQKSIEEIAKLSLEEKVNPQKDTNLVFKKRKYVAQLKTIASSVKE